jgi:hypothetical protein
MLTQPETAPFTIKFSRTLDADLRELCPTTCLSHTITITLPHLSILSNALSTVINQNIGALMSYSDYLKVRLRASSSVQPFLSRGKFPTL